MEAIRHYVLVVDYENETEARWEFSTYEEAKNEARILEELIAERGCAGDYDIYVG